MQKKIWTLNHVLLASMDAISGCTVEVSVAINTYFPTLTLGSTQSTALISHAWLRNFDAVQTKYNLKQLHIAQILNNW